MAASIFFDEVPECMIETLLIVHGSGDRNSPEFTQVCERWTCILAPWIRTLQANEWPHGKHLGRWTGRCYWWCIGTLQIKGVYRGGKKDGLWETWHWNGQLDKRGMFVDSNKEGEWCTWYSDGTLYMKNGYRNGKRHGEWKSWYITGEVGTRSLYDNGRFISRSSQEITLGYNTMV